jgi:hypothetical protein
VYGLPTGSLDRDRAENSAPGGEKSSKSNGGGGGGAENSAMSGREAAEAAERRAARAATDKEGEMDVGCAWLLRQGYEVYRNVSQHGLIDMIAIKDGKPLL